MATFYLLPPRVTVGAYVRSLLDGGLPGLPLQPTPDRELADWLATALERPGDAFVIHREDLPDDADVEAAIRDGFGAEPGDRVVEVRLGAPPAGLRLRAWTLEAAGAASDPLARLL